MLVYLSPPKPQAIVVGFFFILINYTALAQCTSTIGSITIPDSGSYYLCYGETKVFQVDSFTLAESQELYYVFHTQPYLFNSIIIEYNQTGLYQNYLTLSEELFATAIIAEENASSNINFDDSCLISSNTVSIFNLDPIQIESEENCRSPKGFSFSISGGLPEFVVDSYYEVSGSHFNGKVKPNELITIETEYQGFIPKYEINVKDDKGCEASYVNSIYSCYHLPIQLITFDGQATDTGNLLIWTVKARTDIDFFKIEVSKNGVDWFLVDTIKADRTFLEIAEYEFLDKNLSGEICYYTLSMTDVDGTSSFIGVIQIAPSNYFKVYPTMANNSIFVHYNGAAPAHLQIFDTNGRQVFSFNEEDDITFYPREIDISYLSSNMYFLVISSDGFTASQKFVVQR